MLNKFLTARYDVKKMIQKCGVVKRQTACKLRFLMKYILVFHPFGVTSRPKFAPGEFVTIFALSRTRQEIPQQLASYKFGKFYEQSALQ